MYAGHAALALLAKAKRPRVALALLVPIAYAPDCIEWIADVLGHRNREISHSLVSVGIGASLAALIYWLATRRPSDALAIWLMYASHWPADYITGLKPTWPGGPWVGLQLYTHPVWDAWLECALVVVCWLAYRQSLPAQTRRRALLVLVPLGLIGMQIGFAARIRQSGRVEGGGWRVEGRLAAREARRWCMKHPGHETPNAVERRRRVPALHPRPSTLHPVALPHGSCTGCV